jgi:UDP-N-acetylglucosamine 2-epimerase (non-hydrolysing)
MRRRVVSIVGTRPEIIKMSPVIKEFGRRRDLFDHKLVATGQHRQMLDQFFSAFDIYPDVDLNLMEHDQSLASFASRSLASLSTLFSDLRPDIVLIQGDTTTVMTAALAAFYQGIAVGHVEAGLRSFDTRNPFPEEINRRLASCLAGLHFAPTERARLNLLAEGVPPETVFVTGNTIVDALESISLDDRFDDEHLADLKFETGRVLLVTAHRRENLGRPLHSICDALKTIIERFEDVEIIYPVHLNPNVTKIVHEELGGMPRLHLVKPVSYADLLRLMERCYLILTDSGGIQEEAPSYRKPVLVLREVTERPEIIEANAGRIVGTDAQRIVGAVEQLLTDKNEYSRMRSAANPFGDGRAAIRIVDIIAERL